MTAALITTLVSTRVNCVLWKKIVETHEAQAPDDVGLAHRISHRDRAHWARIGETIETLARARLTFARLEPLFASPARTMSPVARRLMRQLSARLDIPARLEALSDRLEALEDLYEGANDRIADYRGWHKGHVMEIIIILLLLLEIVLMGGDLWLHYLELGQCMKRGGGVSGQWSERKTLPFPH